MKEFNSNHDTIIQKMIRCHFEPERQAIVKKALERFKVVLDSGGEFTALDDDLSNAIKISSPQETSRSNLTAESTTRQTISEKNEAVCDLIRQNYERTDDPERFTTPTSIRDFIIKNMSTCGSSDARLQPKLRKELPCVLQGIFLCH